MSYALTFADPFFDELDAIAPSKRPLSLYQAIISIEKETWRDLARHVFGVVPERLDADAVFRAAVETDTCSNLTSPVEVWVDPEGDYTVLVFDPSSDAI